MPLFDSGGFSIVLSNSVSITNFLKIPLSLKCGNPLSTSPTELVKLNLPFSEQNKTVWPVFLLRSPPPHSARTGNRPQYMIAGFFPVSNLIKTQLVPSDRSRQATTTCYHNRAPRLENNQMLFSPLMSTPEPSPLYFYGNN